MFKSETTTFKPISPNRRSRRAVKQTDLIKAYAVLLADHLNLVEFVNTHPGPKFQSYYRAAINRAAEKDPLV